MENWVRPDLSTAALNTFFHRAKKAGTEIHTLQLYENGECLIRWAVAPYDCAARREMYSLSKIFTSTAAGIAYTRGLLDPDDLVSRWYPEYTAAAAQKDARWAEMRVRDILSMTTGHEACVMPSMAFAPDAPRAFFQAPLSYDPGTHFTYNTGASCMAAALVQLATGQTVPDLLAREFFAPIGRDAALWRTCADGHCIGGAGLCASSDDIVQLGLLYLNGGVLHGRRLLAPEWIEAAVSAHASTADKVWPDWCEGYGFHFWRNARGGYRGDGAFGQYCLILPERRQLLVVTAESAEIHEEIALLWELLDHIHEGGPRAELPRAYAPRGTLSESAVDTGWLSCADNPMGFTALRLCKSKEEAVLRLCDGSRMQTLHAPSGTWRENLLFAKHLRPTIYTMLPRTEREALRLCCAASDADGALRIECRSMDTPHAFEIVCRLTSDGVRLEFCSPLDVFDPDGARLTASR